MKKIDMMLGLAMVLFVPNAASAGSNQIRVKDDLTVEWYLSPAEFPCLVETIYVSGTVGDRLHVVFNPAGGYTWQDTQTTQNMTAVGLDTGKTYRFSGPLSIIENGATDEPWVTWYPLTFSFHNINHFVGSGSLPNMYLRTLRHLTFDRITGELKTEILVDDVLCN